MAAEDIKERLIEQVKALASRVGESAAWQQLMERYQSLTPNVQRLALSGVGVFLALFLFLLPWSFFSSSQDQMTEFENKKKLIRDMFRFSHQAGSIPRGPEPVSQDQLRNLVQGVLSAVRPTLLPEQNQGIENFDNFSAKSESLPKGLTQKGVIVKLAKLNVEQIVTIGTKLKEILPTVKMVGLKTQANQPDPHYFDASFKLVAFDLPAEPPPKTAPGKPGAPPPKPGANSGGK